MSATTRRKPKPKQPVFRIVRNNPGQPDLHGRSCTGCGVDAAVNIEVGGGSIYISELRLCEPCLGSLRALLSEWSE